MSLRPTRRERSLLSTSTRSLGLCALGSLAFAASLQGPTLRDLELSGTQVGDLDPNVLYASDECRGCHGWFGQATSPYETWLGSLMANAARDPLFWAQLALANQDAPGVGYFCLRCHVPTSFVTGSALDPDGTSLEPLDEDGVTCHFCHSMVDPRYQPGISPPEDRPVVAGLVSVPEHYGNSMFVLDPQGQRRGPRRDGHPQHFVIPSPFHRSSDLCGTCHDVGNPTITRQPDGSYAANPMNQPPPSEDLWEQFPLERTYTEWKLSDFADGGVDMGGLFGGSGPSVVGSCQDCHMPRTFGAACWVGDDRPDLARHDFAGASAWVLEIIGLHHANDPYLDQHALRAGQRRAVSMLQRAAMLELGRVEDRLRVRVINQSGHKLPTGHIEGRRVFLNVLCYDAAGDQVAEYGHYDFDTAELDEATTTIFEMQVGLSPEAAAEAGLPPGVTTHMVLADTIEKDNRIPPRGFDRERFARAGAPVVGADYADGEYWADVEYPLPPEAARAEVTLYYQTVTRHYIETLREGNTSDHWGETLYRLWLQTDRCPPTVMCRDEIQLR